MRIYKNFSEYSDIEKKLFYITNMKPVLNFRALYSDATKDYRCPAEPEVNDKVVIRFRTYRYDVDEVLLVCYEQEEMGERRSEIPMRKADSDHLFDYYEASYYLSDKKMRYHFVITSSDKVCYYNQFGVAKELNQYYDFEIMPGFKVPAWAKGAVIYQIYVDRFCNGNPNNDVATNEYIYIGQPVVRVEDWDKYPDAMDVRAFYGGDLQGVLDKLDYLKNLGVEVIYFNPLFVSPSNHKYDIQDYDDIDPHLGIIINEDEEHSYKSRVTDKDNLKASNELFIKLVQAIHDRGMKVIIDGVFNHCGSFNKWLDKERIYENNENYETGAFIAPDSPYRKYFDFRSENWPYNNDYDGWWGHDTLPKLNYEGSKELEDYIMEVAKKWLLPPYSVDGWRLDVAADLGHSERYNHQFWKRFRKEVKSVNPEAIIMAEHYGDPNPWLQGDEWDTVMNYDAFMEPVSWFLTGMEKHSDAYREDLKGNHEHFFTTMKINSARMGPQAISVALNQISNHDHSRFLTRTNGKVGRTNTLGPQAANEDLNYGVFKAAVVIQMTWPGAPGIYYGDEAGVCGFTDPDNRRTYPWGKENRELIEFHRVAVAMHKDNRVLAEGSFKDLYGERNVIAYARFDKQDSIIVIINNNNFEKVINIPVWEANVTDKNYLRQILQTTENAFSTYNLEYSVDGGYLKIGLRPHSAVVLKKM